MNEEMISQFIDDELDLEEKIAFVNGVHESRRLRDLAVRLLRQEGLLHAAVAPPAAPRRWNAGAFHRALRRARVVPFASGMALAAMLVLGIFLGWPKTPPAAPLVSHRFVIYAPNVSTVALSGSFTDWAVVPLHRSGNSDYWETQLTLTRGEHRFSYILEGARRVPDPTIPLQERDDFGGVNSILEVSSSAV